VRWSESPSFPGGHACLGFFEPGDVVGIKVVANGQPYAHSSFELVLEIIEGLKAAGVKTGHMFVYDRYRDELMDAGYHKILPGDIRWGGLTAEGGDQFQLDYPSFRNDPIAGYDPDTFVKMDLIPYGDDPQDDRKLAITRQGRPPIDSSGDVLEFDHFCGSTKIRTLDISHWSPFLTRT
jgi:hypothetical protein